MLWRMTWPMLICFACNDNENLNKKGVRSHIAFVLDMAQFGFCHVSLNESNFPHHLSYGLGDGLCKMATP